jgi:hypothetical protein
LASCQQENEGDEGQAPYIHATVFGVREQSQTACEPVCRSLVTLSYQ